MSGLIIQACSHDEVWEGAGCMGDALTCLGCGRTKYPEVFGSHGKIVPRPDDDCLLLHDEGG